MEDIDSPTGGEEEEHIGLVLAASELAEVIPMMIAKGQCDDAARSLQTLLDLLRDLGIDLVISPQDSRDPVEMQALHTAHLAKNALDSSFHL